MAAYRDIQAVGIVLLVGCAVLEKDLRLHVDIAQYPEMDRFMGNSVPVGNITGHRIAGRQAHFPVPDFQDLIGAYCTVLHMVTLRVTESGVDSRGIVQPVWLSAPGPAPVPRHCQDEMI